jgi:cytochrome c
VRPRVTLLAALALTACEAADHAEVLDGQGAGEDMPYALPAHAPARFGFGADASAARVAVWDVDVKPDGEGLPLGRGTVAEGETVFRTFCIACHGPTGTEGPNDVLVGNEPWEAWPGSAAIGAYWPYATTLYDYILRAMPQGTPGILSADQTYAVIAYLLYRNGIIAEDAVMSAETLPAVQMPARSRFVMDDREGGALVR